MDLLILRRYELHATVRHSVNVRAVTRQSIVKVSTERENTFPGISTAGFLTIVETNPQRPLDTDHAAIGDSNLDQLTRPQRDVQMKGLQEQKRARDLTSDDRAALIRRLEFGSTLSDALVADIARSSVVLDFRRRRFVYRAGEPADCLYAIVHGRIKLCRIEAESGREAVIDILPEGSLFGESALYSLAGQRANSTIA